MRADPLAVRERLGLASRGTMDRTVLTAVGANAPSDPGDVKLLPKSQLLIRLVDGDGDDVQRTDAGLYAGGLHAVVVAGVGSLFGDGVSTVAALQNSNGSPSRPETSPFYGRTLKRQRAAPCHKG